MSSPPIGFYFCQPLLTSGRQLLRSNVVPLQPPSFFLEHNIRPCLINEFQNCSRPFCAIPGVNIGPNQIIAPAPTVIGTVQYNITPTAINIMTPTALLELQQTPVASNDVTPGDNVNAGLIAGIVVSGIVVFVLAIIAVYRKSQIFPVKNISRNKFSYKRPLTEHVKFVLVCSNWNIYDQS